MPDGNADDFVGYQFFISYINRDKFSVSESYPIEDSRIVYVDLDLNDIASGYEGRLPRKDSRPATIRRIALGSPQGSPTDELIEVANTALASTKIKVGVVPVATAGNPEANASYQVKGKLISAKNDKTDGYQVVLMAATTMPNGSPDFFPVAYAATETNGYFLTGFLIFNDPADIGKLVAAKSRREQG